MFIIERGVLEVVLPGDKWLTWGKGVPGEGQGLEEIMQINYKMSFIKDSF